MPVSKLIINKIYIQVLVIKIWKDKRAESSKYNREKKEIN